jgi:hypothetical protein
MPDLHHDIENRFTYHPPDSAKAELHEMVREKARALAHDLNGLLPEGREKALALTHLEMTVMWANAAIALSHLPRQEY